MCTCLKQQELLTDFETGITMCFDCWVNQLSFDDVENYEYFKTPEQIIMHYIDVGLLIWEDQTNE